jgi:hypothetical protein
VDTHVRICMLIKRMHAYIYIYASVYVRICVHLCWLLSSSCITDVPCVYMLFFLFFFFTGNDESCDFPDS